MVLSSALGGHISNEYANIVSAVTLITKLIKLYKHQMSVIWNRHYLNRVSAPTQIMLYLIIFGYVKLFTLFMNINVFRLPSISLLRLHAPWESGSASLLASVRESWWENSNDQKLMNVKSWIKLVLRYFFITEEQYAKNRIFILLIYINGIKTVIWWQ